MSAASKATWSTSNRTREDATRRITTAICLAGLVLLAPAIAGTNISNSPNWASWAPRVAVDAEGNAMCVWVEVYSSNSGSGDLFASRYAKTTGLWSAPEKISDSGRVWSGTLEVSGIDVDDNNRFHVVWTEQSSVRLRSFGAGGWTGIESVGSGDTLEGAKIAAAGSGDIYLVWWGNDGSVISKARVGGNWDGARTISEGGRRSKFPDVACGNGLVMAAWVEKSGDLYQAAYVTRGRGSGSGWSSVARVAPSSLSQQHPAVEFLNGESPQIVFTPVIDPNRRVAHCAWTGSGFSSPQNISEETMLHYPVLAERTGLLYAAWQVGSYGSGQAVYFNAWANGKWGGATAVPASNGCTFCDIAVEPVGGKATVVWDASGEIYVSLGTGGGVSVPNLAPVADYTFSPQTGLAPIEIQFDGSGSYDPDGRVVQYDWQFGDGETGSGRTAFHTFEKKGSYAVKLTVVDNLGKSGSKIRTVEVLGLLAPLDVRWQTSVDESLFLTRLLTDVLWEPNPANDEVAAIAKYRIWRKDYEEDDPVFKVLAEVPGSVLTWRDTKVKAKDRYAYSVTAMDEAGHESPLSGQGTPTAAEADAAGRDKSRVKLPNRTIRD